MAADVMSPLPACIIVDHSPSNQIQKADDIETFSVRDISVSTDVNLTELAIQEISKNLVGREVPGMMFNLAPSPRKPVSTESILDLVRDNNIDRIFLSPCTLVDEKSDLRSSQERKLQQVRDTLKSEVVKIAVMTVEVARIILNDNKAPPYSSMDFDQIDAIAQPILKEYQLEQIEFRDIFKNKKWVVRNDSTTPKLVATIPAREIEKNAELQLKDRLDNLFEKFSKQVVEEQTRAFDPQIHHDSSESSGSVQIGVLDFDSTSTSSANSEEDVQGPFKEIRTSKGFNKTKRQLWNKIKPIYNQLRKKHPFLKKLKQGTLDWRTFGRYLTLDMRYLDNYASVLLTLAGNWELANDSLESNRNEEFCRGARDYISQLAASAIKSERGVLTKYLESEEIKQEDLGNTSTPRAMQDYLEILKFHTRSSKPLVALSAVIVCLWFYSKIGRHLLNCKETKADSYPFKDFVEYNSSDKVREYSHNLIAIFHEAIESNRLTDYELKNSFDLVARTAEHESKMFDYAFDLEDNDREKIDSLRNSPVKKKMSHSPKGRRHRK